MRNESVEVCPVIPTSDIIQTSDISSCYTSYTGIYEKCNNKFILKQRQIQHRRAGHVPPFEIFQGFVFVNFDCITRIYFNCIHHTMFTICTQFSTLTTKHKVCVKGASKQISDAKNSTAPGTRPPVLKFLDPPLKHTTTAVHCHQNVNSGQRGFQIDLKKKLLIFCL